MSLSEGTKWRRMLPATLQFLITMIACAINERMQRKLDYTQEEVRVLKEIVAVLTGNGRLSFTADQRRRLAVAGKAFSPEERKKRCQIVKPRTILGGFRQMAARKYDSSESKVGRPRKRKDIRKLVVEMALANLGWGYTKIRDALRTGLKIEIGRTTVANMLLEEGIEPAPERERKRTWKRFMKSHWDTLCACDFFSVEALGPFGTVRYMVFFVIELKSRAVEIAGIAVDPGEEWMVATRKGWSERKENSEALEIRKFPSSGCESRPTKAQSRRSVASLATAWVTTTAMRRHTRIWAMGKQPRKTSTYWCPRGHPPGRQQRARRKGRGASATGGVYDHGTRPRGWTSHLGGPASPS